MHIAYIHYVFGASTALNHVQQFVAAARKLGHRIDVHSMNLGPVEDEQTTAQSYRLRARRALKRRLGRYLHDPKEFLWNFRYYRREIALLRESRPDVLLVRPNTQSIANVFVARRLRLPLVMELNGPAEESLLYEPNYVHLHALQEWAMAWKLKHADAVTVVSSALRDYFLERYSLPREKFTVAPNGADVELFRPGRDPDPSYLRDESRPRVGFVGSFQRFHGAELLFAMIDKVSAACPEARFLLVGGGSGSEHVAAQAARNERVDRVGQVPHDRVPGLVASLDVGVMPASNFYGSPLKVLEWMAAGRAVVAPRHGPLEEILKDGVEGILFPPGDLDALCTAVVRLLRDPDLRTRLGEAAASRVRASLTWQHNAEKVISACASARERYRSSPPA